MKRTPTRMLAIGLGAGLIALTACGSDSNDSEPAATEVPVATDEMAEEEMAEEEMAEEEMAEEEAAATVVDVAIANDFTTLVAAVQAADLVDTLAGEGPFTVFAPTDEAFAALPAGALDALLLPENKDALSQILTYHVVSGDVMSTDLSSGMVPTVQGENVDVVVDGGVTVNGANVILADVKAGNGVVHVIDAVLIPPSVDVAALLAG